MLDVRRMANANTNENACPRCGKEFLKKAGLTAHGKRKTPCKAVEEEEFRDVSKGFNRDLTKEERQEQGIFFTPKKARDLLFAKLQTLGVKPKTILEPSFGSGEFLLDAKAVYPESTLYGVEKNEKLFKSLKLEGANLTCCDFLEWEGRADLILGNPPYFVMPSAKGKCEEAMTGRPNIYVLFLYKCLKEHLNDGGVLAFIIPTSLYNCSYYQPMRNYIAQHTTVRHVETLDKPGFFETGQETMLLILEKGKHNNDFLFNAPNGNIYLSPACAELSALSKGATTLRDLGLGAKTGNIVWNQVKGDLQDAPTGGSLLVYSSNIKDGSLVLNKLTGTKGLKKQYVVSKKPTISGPVILVERGYGNSFRFNAVRTDLKDFYAENHVNVIYPKTPDAVKHLDRVMKSMNDVRCSTFMKTLIGNGSISATDMETLMPVL